MKITTGEPEKINDNIYRYQVFVNRKNQGFIRNFVYSEKNSFWQLENDSTKTTFKTKDEAIEALCAKNGRKLKK